MSLMIQDSCILRVLLCFDKKSYVQVKHNIKLPWIEFFVLLRYGRINYVMFNIILLIRYIQTYLPKYNQQSTSRSSLSQV